MRELTIRICSNVQLGLVASFTRFKKEEKNKCNNVYPTSHIEKHHLTINIGQDQDFYTYKPISKP